MAVVRVFFMVLSWLVFKPLWRRTDSASKSREPSEGFIAVWTLLAFATGLFIVMASIGVWIMVPVSALCLVLLFPWVVTRAVLIPLGLSRTARIVGGLSGWTWGRDRAGGGLVAGAWAILRQRQPRRDRMAELETVRDRQGSLSAAQVFATGLLAAARGDLESARMIINSVDEVGAKRTSHAVHALAREWLVVDAAERGAWADVARLADGERARTRLTRLLGAIAARLAGLPGARSGLVLWCAWLVTNHRRHTFSLVRRATAVSVTRDQESVPIGRRLETSLKPDCYTDALSAHVFTLARDASLLDLDDIARLAGVWDRALSDPSTHARVMRRAAVLGARSGDDALRALADAVSRDVANMARAAGVPIAECKGNSRVLADAQHWLRNDLLSEIEMAFDAMQARAIHKRALSPIDEWREYLSLRALYVRAYGLGGMGFRQLAFPHVHHTVCKLSVWLWNERQEYLMSNAMFRWLLDEAMIVGDAEAIDLQGRNWDSTI